MTVNVPLKNSFVMLDMGLKSSKQYFSSGCQWNKTSLLHGLRKIPVLHILARRASCLSPLTSEEKAFMPLPTYFCFRAVRPSVHLWSYTISFLARHLTSHLWGFHWIYNFAGTRFNLARFNGPQCISVSVMAGLFNWLLSVHATYIIIVITDF